MADKYLLGFLSRGNVDYIDSLYEQFEKDPYSVPEPWFGFFVGMTIAPPSNGAGYTNGNGAARPSTPVVATGASVGVSAREAFQRYGIRVAAIHPLDPPTQALPELDPRRFGIGSEEGWKTPQGQEYLALRAAYAGTLAIEMMHLESDEERQFLANEMERSVAERLLAGDAAHALYRELYRAEALEQFLHTRFIGQKRFSVEGAESLIPLLDATLDEVARHGANDAVLGMAHRGRLNVLVNLLGKPYEKLFCEFLGVGNVVATRDGDVKYHLGGTAQYETAGGNSIALELVPNPSHLELVNPVVGGIVSAKQARHDNGGKGVLPLLVHGEAAFAGQGIVFETLTLTNLPKTTTHGTVHVVVNNQVGFTADGGQTRLSRFPTEAAKMLGIPVLHVNGTDAEAAVQAGRVAARYRQKFGRDVFVHLSCIRKYGHNEGDDPTFTQPVLYRRLERFPSVTARYRQLLTAAGRVDEAALAASEKETQEQLEEALKGARATAASDTPRAKKEVVEPETRTAPSNTGVSAKVLGRIGDSLVAYPDGFTVHPKVGKILEQRAEMAHGEKPVDWGCGEMFAYGSLLLEGTNVRLHGQDCERGTFSHRHSVLHDTNDGKLFLPLSQLAGAKAQFTAFNSMLSELAVLGYEYGRSLADPKCLALWEAQFGDFVNGAQPILDQYLAPGETKWGVYSGLVLLLPHGYEGQGPEHSSARLERFLELSAKDNWTVCQPTTPAQYFHMIRRHAAVEPKRPLIVMTPKSLLRLPQAASPLEEFTKGAFVPVFAAADEPADATTVLLCTGKIAYTLAAERASRKRTDVAIVRMEQLYPLPTDALAAVLKRFKKAPELVWVQDEPENMGAWRFLMAHATELFPEGRLPRYCGRPASPSPATGYAKRHEQEEAGLLAEAFGEAAKAPVSKKK